MNARKPQAMTHNRHNPDLSASATRRRLGIGLLAAALFCCGTLQAGGPNSGSSSQPTVFNVNPQIDVQTISRSIITPPLNVQGNSNIHCDIATRSASDQTVTVSLHVQESRNIPIGMIYIPAMKPSKQAGVYSSSLKHRQVSQSSIETMASVVSTPVSPNNVKADEVQVDNVPVGPV